MQIEKLWKLKSFHGFFYLLPSAKSRKGVDFCLCILYNALANRNRTSPKIQRMKGRPPMKKLSHFSKGMGIGGWLTNYKRLAMLPENKRFVITDGNRFSLMDDDRREVLSKELLDVLLGK